MTHILLTNVYSYKNKGDAAIVLSLIQEIKRVFPNSDLLIQTTDIKHDKGKYGAPVTSSLLWILLSSVRDKSFALRLLVLGKGIAGLTLYIYIYKWLHRHPKFLLSKPLQQFVQENRQADLAIACGGGYIRTASKSLQDTILLAVTCLNFLIAKSLGKPVYLYSQSIGPVHGNLQKIIVRFSLNRVDLIEPREDISLTFLQKLSLKNRIAKTADPALLLGQCGLLPEAVKLPSRRLRVGITVRNWFKEPADLEQYIAAMAKIIDYLITERNAQVFYIPQVIAKNFGDDDRLIAEKVQEHISQKNYFTLVSIDLHPFEVIGLCGKMDIFIGTRMHSNIFALINHVPVVAIEYEHKTRGIMRGLGLESLTIDIQDVTFLKLKEKVSLLLEERDHYQTLIKQNLPKQIEESRQAIEIIKEMYDKATV